MSTNPKKIDLTGQVFGRWSVIRQNGNRAGGAALWLCRCVCGTERTVAGSDLRSGKSSGCRRKCNGVPVVNNVQSKSMKHGGTGTRLYTAWKNMRQRCSNKGKHNYYRYGGRGISVCAEWDSFPAFRDWAMSNGYTDELTLERRDSNGNYCPENCTWADYTTQARNREFVHRSPDGRPWAEIAIENGISVYVMHNRVWSGGWSFEDAATWPIGKPRVKRGRKANGQWEKQARISWKRKNAEEP